MELYDLLKRAKENDKDATYEIIKDFDATLKKLSKCLHYEEAEIDLIIELLILIKTIDMKIFKYSTHKQIAKYIHMHLKKRTLNLFKKHKSKFKEFVEINYEIISDQTIGDIENIALISILIQSLVKRQQDVIILEFIQDFSEKDIAKILGISRQAVNRTKNRALDNLRRVFIEDRCESIERKDDRVNAQPRVKRALV
ncbi:RNA polymerase sigma factor, sigma-70 family [Anaerovirgula multivorans]|uniref:RNA polymerase sigma factor, sigma-70 family n=1 Tax=Anaerovirgula multivorans TaxID=312168 RepID=A0A239J617_9FIRM|nr:sigma-70 family RNA polymerase sigma factor [Anaerovirgula multivorans]SNT01486.1 RNA polymerase sigma factor, sigma-70 family [Anaerovirgula multivorans]